MTGNQITLKLHKASGTWLIDMMVILESPADAGGKPARSTARCLSSSKSNQVSNQVPIVAFDYEPTSMMIACNVC